MGDTSEFLTSVIIFYVLEVLFASFTDLAGLMSSHTFQPSFMSLNITPLFYAFSLACLPSEGFTGLVLQLLFLLTFTRGGTFPYVP